MLNNYSKRHIIIELFYIIYMIYFLHVTNSIFNTNNKVHALTSIIIGFILYIIFVLTIFKTKKIEKVAKEGILVFVIPMIIISSISFITAKMIHNIENNSIITQSIIRLCLYVSAFIMAYYSVKIFGKKTLKLILIAGVISYMSVIMKWIMYADINQIFNIFNNSINGVSLEVHGLTYYFGLIFLYFVMDEQIEKKRNKVIYYFLIFLIILGNKRAIYGALIACTGLYYFLNKKNNMKKNSTIIRFISILCVFIPLMYIILIKYGIISELLLKFNINDNYRLAFWMYFNNYYEISPSYWGRGIQFTDILMDNSTTMYQLGITVKTQIHNDILKQYIGWGFISFIYYYINCSYIQIKHLIKKYGNKISLKYLIILIYSIFIFAFDNMFDGAEFHYIFFVIWFLLLKEGEKKNDNKENTEIKNII